MTKQTVKIQYGIFGGERRGKRMRKALRAAGYGITRNAEKADIIIGHSAGCFWLPQAPTHQKLMLIDPPYWPGKSPRERSKSRLKSNLRRKKYGYTVRYWLSRNLWGVYYAIRDFKRTRAIIHHVHVYNLPEVIKNHRIVVVRNDDDDWLGPDLRALKAANPKLVIRHFPGDHDDCMYNPQPYVNLLQSDLGEPG